MARMRRGGDCRTTPRRAFRAFIASGGGRPAIRTAGRMVSCCLPALSGAAALSGRPALEARTRGQLGRGEFLLEPGSSRARMLVATSPPPGGAATLFIETWAGTLLCSTCSTHGCEKRARRSDRSSADKVENSVGRQFSKTFEGLYAVAWRGWLARKTDVEGKGIPTAVLPRLQFPNRDAFQAGDVGNAEEQSYAADDKIRFKVLGPEWGDRWGNVPRQIARLDVGTAPRAGEFSRDNCGNASFQRHLHADVTRERSASCPVCHRTGDDDALIRICPLTIITLNPPMHGGRGRREKCAGSE